MKVWLCGCAGRAKEVDVGSHPIHNAIPAPWLKERSKNRLTPMALPYYPHDRREGVLFFFGPSFGATTQISCKFEIVFTHDLILV